MREQFMAGQFEQVSEIEDKRQLDNNSLNALEKYERRMKASDKIDCYEKLSFAQKFAASRLTQYGYQLQFIRESTPKKIAIFICEDRIATVNLVGEINLSPNIQLREGTKVIEVTS